MSYTLEQIFQSIGQSIMNSAVGEWEKSVLKIKFQKGMVGFNLNFYNGNDYKC
jgi:hypothetical protein